MARSSPINKMARALFFLGAFLLMLFLAAGCMLDIEGIASYRDVDISDSFDILVVEEEPAPELEIYVPPLIPVPLAQLYDECDPLVDVDSVCDHAFTNFKCGLDEFPYDKDTYPTHFCTRSYIEFGYHRVPIFYDLLDAGAMCAPTLALWPNRLISRRDVCGSGWVHWETWCSYNPETTEWAFVIGSCIPDDYPLYFYENGCGST